jgi:hypothetical protein
VVPWGLVGREETIVSFICAICGREHESVPRDMAYRRPAHVFDVPEAEWPQRVYCTDDLCVVDGQHFLIRGILALPIAGTDEEFRWGPWAQVEQADFKRYYELWDDATEETLPPFPGWLSGNLRAYPDSDQLEVRVYVQAPGQRPRFRVVSAAHPLGIDQRVGISEARAHEFVADLIR